MCVCACVRVYVCACVRDPDLMVGGVQQAVQVLQGGGGLVFEAGQQPPLDGSELDRSLSQQVLVLMGAHTQLHTHTHTHIHTQVQTHTHMQTHK